MNQPRAKLHGRTGYHIEVDGEVFKSQGSAGYGGGDSSPHDKKRREIAALICIAVNQYTNGLKEINNDSEITNT